MKRVEFTKNTPHEYRSAEKWRMDPKGYCVIKVFYARKEIGLRHYTKSGVLDLELRGDDSYEMVHYLIDNEHISSLQHAAYLGHELQKAQIAMRNRLYYNQDERIDFSQKTTRDPSQNSGK